MDEKDLKVKKTYKIKSLDWNQYVYSPDEIQARTLFGVYYITHSDDGRYVWRWHNNQPESCSSFENGKKKAWDHWVKNVEWILDEVQ